MQLLSSKTPGMKQRIALCLPHLLEDAPADLARAFSSYGGAAVLLDAVCDVEAAVSKPAEWQQGVEALRLVVQLCEGRARAARRAPKAVDAENEDLKVCP